MRLALVAAGLLLAAAAGGVWLKSPAEPGEAVSVARDFVAHVAAGRYADAHALTPKGSPLPDFEARARAEVCPADRVASTAPTQTHGNRLRRRLAGTDPAPPEVRVEFEADACLLSVMLRPSAGKTWQVVRFARHAG